MPILLHGDAAFVGQGIVAETLNLSGIDGYSTGGTIHIITNNQIGFTTLPNESRSCQYSSDISKFIRAPVLHVNADDPEAVIWVAELAMAYRARFKKDVVIDLIGYRRYGHNETDEPRFTQPLMYKKISQHPTVLSQYRRKLVEEGWTQESVEAPTRSLQQSLQQALDRIRAKEAPVSSARSYPRQFACIFEHTPVERPEVMATTRTRFERDSLIELGQKMTTLPSGFKAQNKLIRLLQSRHKMLGGKGAIDWGFSELLALASLSKENFGVRLTGQDSRRGTFSSRHAVWYDTETGQPYEYMNQIGPGDVQIINSPLSEQGCLGFEFGYSIATPNSLVLWEAQFGDFVNGAQIIIDQFLVASEAKWKVTSGLVLLLPHGYEGMGPEHSSARPERFLQCCGNFNIQVCNLTTPAQLFHVLRRQMLRRFRKPLVIMTPKSLLRHQDVISPISDFTDRDFREVLEDSSSLDHSKVERLILCTGKIYYELVAYRGQNPGEHTAVPILRCEQLYPFPYESIQRVTNKYPQLKEILWVQEEPHNMGGWGFVQPRLQEHFGSKIKVSYVGRKHSGSTAEGSAGAHAVEQQRVVKEAFTFATGWEPKVLSQK